MLWGWGVGRVKGGRNVDVDGERCGVEKMQQWVKWGMHVV